VDKTFGSGVGKMKNGARRKFELGLTASAHNFEFSYQIGKGTALGEILVLIWAYFTQNFDIDIGRAA
jgi:hypothetical protein